MRVAIFETLKEWEDANLLAHETLVKLKGYNSKQYSGEPLMSVDDKYLLPELEHFSKELKVINFVDFDLKKLKQEEL